MLSELLLLSVAFERITLGAFNYCLRVGKAQRAYECFPCGQSGNTTRKSGPKTREMKIHVFFFHFSAPKSVLTSYFSLATFHRSPPYPLNKLSELLGAALVVRSRTEEGVCLVHGVRSVTANLSMPSVRRCSSIITSRTRAGAVPLHPARAATITPANSRLLVPTRSPSCR